MIDQLDEFHLAAWRAFLNAHAAVIDRIEREMAAAGVLPLGSYDVLVALHEAPDQRLRLKELASHIVLSRSTLTRLLDRLEADRRGAYAVLTARGEEALRLAWPIYARGIAAHFTSLLQNDDIRVLTRALGRVSDAARQDS